MVLILSRVENDNTTTPHSKFSKTEMDEGAVLVEEFLKAWAAGGGASSSQDGDDVVMQDGSAGSDSVEEKQLKHLQDCYARFRPKLEANPWCREVLQAL